jgi:hypothetical protein
MPAFALSLGALIFGAFALGDDVESGVYGFGVMAILAAVFAFGGRSETIRGLAGPGRDERWELIDLRATAFAGLTVLTVMIGAWLYDLAQGGNGNPYGTLLAISGVAYIVGVAVGRWRS